MEKIQEGIRLVKSVNFNVSRAAVAVGIPRSTLKDYIKGKRTAKAYSLRPELLLSEKEESAVVKYILEMADTNTPLCRDHMQKIIEEIISHPNNPSGWALRGNADISASVKRWMHTFFQRHVELRKKVKVSKPDVECAVFITRNESGDIDKIDVIR